MNTVFVLIESCNDWDGNSSSPVIAYRNEDEAMSAMDEKNKLLDELVRICPLREHHRKEDNGEYDNLDFGQVDALFDEAWDKSKALWSKHGLNHTISPSFTVRSLNVI